MNEREYYMIRGKAASAFGLLFAHLVQKYPSHQKWKKADTVIKSNTRSYGEMNVIVHKVKVESDDKPGTEASG